VLQPTSLRRSVERGAMVLLAGDPGAADLRRGLPAAEERRRDRGPSGWSPWSPLCRRAREEIVQLEEAERGEPQDDDETKALKMTSALSWHGVSGPHYLGWLAAETEGLLRQTHVCREVEAMTEALLAREVVGARATRAIVKHAREGGTA
jgi:hypothetical protein